MFLLQPLLILAAICHSKLFLAVASFYFGVFFTSCLVFHFIVVIVIASGHVAFTITAVSRARSCSCFENHAFMSEIS